MLEFIKDVKNKIEIELEKKGILQPKIEIEIPKELVKQITAASYPATKSKKSKMTKKEVIDMIKRSKWVTEYCKARSLPPEARGLTEEELKTKYPELYKVFDTCRTLLAERIYERYA